MTFELIYLHSECNALPDNNKVRKYAEKLAAYQCFFKPDVLLFVSNLVLKF